MVIQIFNRFFQFNALNHKDMSQPKEQGVFWVGVLAYTIGVYLLFGYGLFSGEMWAEAATIYFHNASGNISQLLVRDAGYFVWPQQIIVWIGYVLSLPSQYIPYFYNIMATIITGMMIFSFSLSRFRCLISNDIYRLIICILIACIGSIETRQFINFTYYSAFFMSVTFAMMIVSRPKEMPWYVWTLPVFFLGKPAILSLVPILGLSLFYVKNNFRLVVLLCFLAVFIQLLNAYFIFDGKSGANYLFTERLITLFDHLKVHINGLIHSKYTVKLPIIMQYILATGIISYLIYICYVWKHPSKILIIFGLIMIIDSDIIVSFGLKGGQFLHWQGSVKSYNIFRWTVIPIFGTLLIASSLCYYISEKLPNQKKWFIQPASLLLFWFILSLWIHKVYGRIKPPKIQSHTIAWQQNSRDNTFDNFCTAIAPLGWVYSPKGICHRLGKGGINPVKLHVQKNQSVDLLKPETLDNRLLQSIVVVYRINKDALDHKLTLKVNDEVYTKDIEINTKVAKNMIVQFNLPEMIRGNDINTISMKSTESMHVDINEENKAHAHWYVKR